MIGQKSLKKIVKKSPAIDAFILTKKLFTSPKSQFDEEININRIIRTRKIHKRFIEFGFSGWEFNCAHLMKLGWGGLLIDADSYNTRIGDAIFPRGIQVLNRWLDVDNLTEILNYGKEYPLGILSIDVDGNDYFFFRELISIKPQIIIVEYNSSFGLRPITVNYSSDFDRFKKHESGLYYGASLAAFNKIAVMHNYSLFDVSSSGVNAYFIRNDMLTSEDVIRSPDSSFREKVFPGGERPSDQWNKIKNLEYVEV